MGEAEVFLESQPGEKLGVDLGAHVVGVVRVASAVVHAVVIIVTAGYGIAGLAGVAGDGEVVDLGSGLLLPDQVEPVGAAVVLVGAGGRVDGIEVAGCVPGLVVLDVLVSLDRGGTLITGDGLVLVEIVVVTGSGGLRELQTVSHQIGH